jgi:hypothetical protein
MKRTKELKGIPKTQIANIKPMIGFPQAISSGGLK